MTSQLVERPTREERAPARFIPCWVGEIYPELGLCAHGIAEWLTNGRDGAGRWLPTCTGCKDRFVRLNQTIMVRRLP